MTVYSLGGVSPEIDEDTWIAPGAHVIGKVKLGAGVGVWFGATIRGDREPIVIGEATNLQEGVIAHTDPGFPLTVGDGCTIGHGAIIHGCTIGNNVLVGMGATILNGAVIGDDCLIGAGALVTERSVIPAGSLVVGAPAKVKRELSPEQVEKNRVSARTYRKNMENFRDALTPESAAKLENTDLCDRCAEREAR